MSKQSGAHGALGEELAARFLQSKGYAVIERNFHARFGEIDLIAKDADTLLFVEVKARGIASLGVPCEAVNHAKQQKLIKTALHYISLHGLPLQPRFDVIEVYIHPTGTHKIRQIKNAFEAGDFISGE